MSTYNEAQIQARHQERVSALVDLFGSTHQIPRDLIDRLQERNKEDWVQFVAERDGKAKSDPDAPLMPVVTDEQVTAVDEWEWDNVPVEGLGEVRVQRTKPEPKPEPKTVADMAVVNAEEIPDEPYGTDEPDAQTVADCDDAVAILAEQNGESALLAERSDPNEEGS